MAFVVCYQGGIAIRTAPDIDAPYVGEVLQWNEASTEGVGGQGARCILISSHDKCTTANMSYFYTHEPAVDIIGSSVPYIIYFV